MESEKRLPEGLAKKQERQRQESINKVLRSIADLKNEGRNVTISALIEYTGLSRSTFSKVHIRELLVEHGYVPGDNPTTSSKRKKVSPSERISEKDHLIAALRIKNTELESECELLRGRLFLAMQR